LDAAHIKWHQADRPDTEPNGLALCVLHHKTFDLGVFTVDEASAMLVSNLAVGTSGFVEGLMRHHGQPIRPPQRPEWRPDPGFLRWHGKEVFKGEPRHRAG
jgi:putative restriction endonuclease